MIAGIPGTGIGGLFYLLIALWMPVRELFLKMLRRGCHRRRRLVKKHLFITVSVIIGMWATIELVDWLLIQTRMLNNNSQNILHVAPFLLTLAALIFVYLGLHVLRFCVIIVEKKSEGNESD